MNILSQDEGVLTLNGLPVNGCWRTFRGEDKIHMYYEYEQELRDRDDPKNIRARKSIEDYKVVCDLIPVLFAGREIRETRGQSTKLQYWHAWKIAPGKLD